MPTKRKDGRYQSSVILENPITGEKTRRYFYGYTLQELEAERRRIMNANISDFLLVETFHRFADEFLVMKRNVDKLEASTLSTYQGFLARHILPQIPPTMKIADVKPALLKHILAQIDGDRPRLQGSETRCGGVRRYDQDDLQCPHGHTLPCGGAEPHRVEEEARRPSAAAGHSACEGRLYLSLAAR